MWVSSNQTNDAELHSIINNQVEKQNAKSQMETAVLKKTHKIWNKWWADINMAIRFENFVRLVHQFSLLFYGRNEDRL